jgi:hypothetical protein
MAALGTLFNVLALNLVLIIVSLPVITLPAAVNAATVALDQWRNEGEERVVRSFVNSLRTQPFCRTTLLTGVPLAAVAVGITEVRHFAAGRAALAAHVAMGLGTGGLVITFVSLGYVFLLTARGTELPGPELWSASVRLGIRNLFRTGPLFLIEIVAAITLTRLDPALLILGLPTLLLQLMRLTAQSGLRRIK